MNQALILALISSCIALNLGADCNSESVIVYNEELEGATFETVGSTNDRHCRDLCTYNLRCEVFTYSRTELKCSLKERPSGKSKKVNGAVSGYPLRSCPFESPCDTAWASLNYYGKLFKGKAYQNILTSDERQCRIVCEKDPLCSIFTYIKSSYNCELKFWPKVPELSVPRVDGLISGYSSKLKLNLGSGSNCISIKVFNYVYEASWRKYEYAGGAVSIEQCQTMCNLNPFCQFYAYITKDGVCYMKKTKEGNGKMFYQDGVISGPRQSNCKIDFSWVDTPINGYFLARRDKKQNQPSAEACKKLCDDDAKCTAYTYVTEQYSSVMKGECNFYYNRDLPTPDVVRDSNVVSGPCGGFGAGPCSGGGGVGSRGGRGGAGPCSCSTIALI